MVITINQQEFTDVTEVNESLQFYEDGVSNICSVSLGLSYADKSTEYLYSLIKTIDNVSISYKLKDKTCTLEKLALFEITKQAQSNQSAVYRLLFRKKA